jgi:hypothetical protein
LTLFRLLVVLDQLSYFHIVVVEDDGDGGGDHDCYGGHPFFMYIDG